MKIVYEANSAVEAHMIANLLGSYDITAEVFGEHLQGGVGEVQALGYVKVLVDEEDYQKADQIIKEFESSEPVHKAPVQAEEKRVIKYAQIGFGVVLGIVITHLTLFALSRSFDGDLNDDGKIDLIDHYDLYGMIKKSELDRNYDGNMDSVTYYNYNGVILELEADDDFDGYFETKIKYQNGLAKTQRTDTDKDGFHDLMYKYNNGALVEQVLYDPVFKRAIKKTQYSPFLIKSSQYDADGNGSLETVLEYDKYENPF